jgi:hypothetical protein
MLASASRNSITVVASSVCSDSVALASVASSDWAIALFSSMRRRTWPQISGVQLAVPSNVAVVTLPRWVVPVVVEVPVVVPVPVVPVPVVPVPVVPVPVVPVPVVVVPVVVVMPLPA